jgi:hypothetical protein
MKLTALRVEVNGESLAIAGAEGLTLLTGMVSVGSGQESTIDPSKILVCVMGMDVYSPQPRQLTWGTEIKLKPGDRVTFQVVKVEHASAPDSTVNTPSSAQLAAKTPRETKKRSAKKA